jgi:hypothetical protein
MFTQSLFVDQHLGQVYNGLRVVAYSHRIPRSHQYWKCECIQCGREYLCVASQLLRDRYHCKPCWRYTGTQHISGTYWNNLRQGALLRGFAFEVTIDEADALFVEQRGRCAYTDLPLSPPSRQSGRYDWSKVTASFDRLDSRRGYVLGNVQWVHKDVNLMKMAISEDRFLEICRLVTKQRAALGTPATVSPSTQPLPAAPS